MLLQVPFQWHVHEAPYDYYRYTEFGLKYMFAKAGFSDVQVTPNTGFWSTVVLKANYHSLRFIRGPRPMRVFLRMCAFPLWFFAQHMAFGLDKIDRHPAETAGYTVVAGKN